MTRNKKNILLISPSPVDGYPPVQHQSRLLADAGYSVYLLTSNLSGSIAVTFSYPGVSIISLHVSSHNFFKRQIMRLIYIFYVTYYRISKRPDCEISYDTNGLFFTRICPFKPKTIIAHLHEMLIDPENIFYEKFSVPLLRKLKIILVADRDRATYLTSQINLPHIPFVARNVPLLKGEIEINYLNKKNSFSAVYIGSISNDQAIDKIVMSMVDWPGGVTFHLYGRVKPEIKENLISLARTLGVDSNIKFEGWVDYQSLINKIREHSLGFSFYLPSQKNHIFSSGASNKRYQYMQAGIPQITDDSPGSRELIEGNAIGLSVSPESPEAIAQAVNYLHQNPNVCVEYGARARKLVIDKYHYELEFKPVLDLIESSCSS